MSQENVEIVREASEKGNRGDLDAISELMDDDVVLRMAEGWPERVFFGKAAARSFFDGWVETVGGDTVIEEAIDAGAVVILRLRALGARLERSIPAALEALVALATTPAGA